MLFDFKQSQIEQNYFFSYQDMKKTMIKQTFIKLLFVRKFQISSRLNVCSGENKLKHLEPISSLE
jgi:hypothetical protein